MFIAHKNETGIHSLKDHLSETADKAKEFAEGLSPNTAFITGLYHDYGKFSEAFQKRINGENIRTDHSSAGARKVSELFKPVGKLMAYCIAGHHAGLPNGYDSTDSCLDTRLKKPVANLPDIDGGGTAPDHVRPAMANSFSLAMYVRILFSCLTDADFLDTENFMSPEKSALRKSGQSIAELKNLFDMHMNNIFKNAADSEINRLRREIYDHCIKASGSQSGLFSLTVPTGGGKTLSSMGFAVNHALKNGLRRIIYVIPYTSIIEQTADIFRSVFGGENVLEHHSSFDENVAYGDFDNDTTQSMKLASENWDAPIVVTTSVQFFESCFSNRPSRCRKLHNIAGSVIIFDEAQLIPYDFFYPCLELIRDLSVNYRTSILMCTATQPFFASAYLKEHRLEGIAEIIPNSGYYQEKFKRVNISILGKLSDADLISRVNSLKSSLTIVSSRKHAFRLYHMLEPDGRFHLSTLMCPEHRRSVLKKMKERLRDGETCKAVSTQLIEAGVDVDFPVVFRSEAGIDSIAQSAGRCNREGRMPSGEVFVFSPADTPSPKLFRQYIQAAEEVTRHHPDILSSDAVRSYFERLYKEKGKLLDRHNILGLLKEGVGQFNFPFKEIAGLFRIISSETIPVIIPYNTEAKSLIQTLRHKEFHSGILRKLQKYTVQIYEYEFRAVKSSLEEINGEFYAAQARNYDPDTGLKIFEDNDKPEDFII